MRVYLPALVSEVKMLLVTGELLNRRASSVTPSFQAEVQAEYGQDADEEFAEYLAMYEAAYSAIDLIATADNAVPLRLVLAADVSEDRVTVNPESPGAIEVQQIRLADVVSAHIDEDTPAIRSAIMDVTRALGAKNESSGSGVADIATAIVEEAELLWYDVSELSSLLQS